MPSPAGPARPGAEWRQLGRYLWAGRNEFGPIGTVEWGWRFRAIDLDGAAVARCRTLDEAQAVLVELAATQPVAQRPF